MGADQSSISNIPVAKKIKKALGNVDDLYAFPDEPFYSWKHVKRYNIDLPTTPFCVAYPKTTKQVSELVKIAAASGLKVQGKSGGHSYCNFSSPDGGMVIDLKHFQKFEMDSKFKCTVGAGTLLGDLTERMYNNGKRAMAHGICPQVGIGGHATIGGLGPSSRLFGAALDHIEEVEIVLANGDIIRASEKNNEDVFWAIKGAGASFGVITEFKVKTEPAPESMVEYRYSFTVGSWQDMSSAFKSWQAFIADQNLPREFASQATITPLGLVISGTYYGSEADFEKFALKSTFPIKKTGEKTIVMSDWLGLLGHWAEDVALRLGGGIPARAYTKTLTFSGGEKDRIPDQVVDDMFKYIETVDKGTLIWFIIFDLAGGYVNTIPMDATAFAHRDALFYLQAYAISGGLIDPVSKTTKDFLGGLTKLIVESMTKDDGHFTDYGAYPGYVDLEIQEPQKAYWRSNLPKLEKIKGKVDPKDVFHNPQSVRPNGKEVPYVLPDFVKGRNASFWARVSAFLRL